MNQFAGPHLVRVPGAWPDRGSKAATEPANQSRQNRMRGDHMTVDEHAPELCEDLADDTTATP